MRWVGHAEHMRQMKHRPYKIF